MRTSGDAPLGGDSRRPLRILRLAHAYDPGRTAAGAGVYASNLGRSLAERGHEFHILTCMPDGERRDYFERDVHIHVRRGLPFSRSRLGVAQSRHAEPRKLPFPWTLIHLYTALSSWVEYRRLGIRFDVIESGDLFAAGLLFALRRRSPLVVRLHTPLAVEAPLSGESNRWDVAVADWMERFLARRAHVLTAASHQVADQLSEMNWVKEKRIAVIPNTTDFSMWDGAGPAAATKPTVVVVGRVQRRKAPEVAVEAMARIAREVPDARLIIAGRSHGQRDSVPYRDWVMKLAAETGVPCEFRHEVARDRLPGLYGSARVVAVPSWQEGFSNVALEAMASRRPVVCTSTTGMAELISGSGAGTVVPPGDPAALAAALLPYLLDPNHAAEAGLCARRLVERLCDPGTVAARHEAEYERAITISATKR